MKKTILSLLFALISVGMLYAQVKFPRDTSYTIQSTYNKLLKYHPGIQPVYMQHLPEVKMVKDMVYQNYGGREMHLDLFFPAASKPDIKLPVVIMIHGGGWISGDKSLQWAMAEKIASKGYVCATVEYRMLLEAGYPAAVVDIKTAVRFLRSLSGNYPIDTEKFAIYGCSAGGQLASLVASTNNYNHYADTLAYKNFSNRIQALIDVDGVLDFLHKDASEVQQGKETLSTRWFGCYPQENRAIWDEGAALTHVDKDFPPTLLLKSQQDRFLAGHQDLSAKLDSLGIYNEYHCIEGSPHSFWHLEPWFTPTSEYVIAFLDKTFKNSSQSINEINK